MSLSLVLPDGQTRRSLDDSQARQRHQHEGQGGAGEGVHGECVLTVPAGAGSSSLLWFAKK